MTALWPSSWTERGRLRPAQTGRVRGCGLQHNTDPSILVDDTGKARWDGIRVCESAWLCPACTTRRRQTAAAEISAGLAGLGGFAQMVTLTIRHDAGVPLATCLEALTSAWTEVRHDGGWCRVWKERVTGSARAVEITRGDHGWHPHVHLLTVVEEPWVEADRDWMSERWARAASRGPAGSSWEPTWLHGVVLSPPTDVSRETSAVVSRYVCKAGLEISGQGKRSASSLWTVAERAARRDAQARRTWDEIAEATRGRHAIHLDSRMRAARDEHAEPEHDVSRETRIRVPTEAAKACAWLERAWHPAALRVPLVLATREGGAAVDAWCAEAVRAYERRDATNLVPWRSALDMPPSEFG